MGLLEWYLLIGIIVLIVLVSTSRNSIGSGNILGDIAVAVFVVLLWPVALFIVTGAKE